MSTVSPIVAILALGALSGLAVSRLRWPLLARSAAAAALATAVWVAGVCLLFYATAPSELGPLMLGPITMAFFVALVPGFLVSWLMRSRNENRGANKPSEATP